MDSFMTCPGLGTLPEARHVVRKTLRAGPVVDDSRTAFALRKPPVDDEFAKRTSLRLYVSVIIAGDIASPTIVIADHHSNSRFNLLSKLLLSISNKLIDRLSVFSGPAVIFFLPLCVG